jgi:hypothetical protein
LSNQAVPLIKVGGYRRNAWVVFTEIITGSTKFTGLELQ